MAQQNNNKLEVYLVYVDGRFEYIVDGVRCTSPEQVRQARGLDKREVVVKWEGVFPFLVFDAYQKEESNLLKILNS